MQVNANSFEYSMTSVKLSYQSTIVTGQRKDEEESSSSQPSVKDFLPKEDAYVPSGNAPKELSKVDQMKAQLNNAQQKLFDQVNELLKKQGMQVQLGQGFWRTIAKGEFKVDAETKNAALEAISEDGEWGVKKTSQRLVDFAKALTNSDPAKVPMMRDAFIKGYNAATEAWGSALPDISKQTYDATMKLFDEWEKSGQEQEDTESKEEPPVQDKPAGM